MTPINQGLYEFNKDSLTEIRKGMGISQSKMAELLGVPANTLSRWETGVTVPDASSLAAIYSLAKESGITPPTFFGIRNSSPDIKMSSEFSGRPEDSLAIFQSLRSYLKTQIEVVGTGPTQCLKIEVRNTALRTLKSPQVVFTGVGLNMASATGDTQTLFGRRGLTTRTIRKPEPDGQATHDAIAAAYDETTATHWEHYLINKDHLNAKYMRVDHRDMGLPNASPAEIEYGELLLPGQSVTWEIDVTPEILPYLQFRVEGTLSRRHLFRCEETFVMPENLTKPIAIRALADFRAIDIHGPLESAIALVPKFDGTTLLTEIQAFSKALSESLAKVEGAKRSLQDFSRKHQLFKFRVHIHARFRYLDRVSRALSRMKEAIASNSTETMASAGSEVLALRGEKAQFDRETQQLMSSYNVSEDELQISASS